jgi:hypothetical protein
VLPDILSKENPGADRFIPKAGRRTTGRETLRGPKMAREQAVSRGKGDVCQQKCPPFAACGRFGAI